jgi:hypothetical protein
MLALPAGTTLGDSVAAAIESTGCATSVAADSSRRGSKASADRHTGASPCAPARERRNRAALGGIRLPSNMISCSAPPPAFHGPPTARPNPTAARHPPSTLVRLENSTQFRRQSPHTNRTPAQLPRLHMAHFQYCTHGRLGRGFRNRKRARVTPPAAHQRLAPPRQARAPATPSLPRRGLRLDGWSPPPAP